MKFIYLFDLFSSGNQFCVSDCTPVLLNFLVSNVVEEACLHMEQNWGAPFFILHECDCGKGTTVSIPVFTE